MLLGPGQPVERLCTFLVVQETLRANSGEAEETSEGGAGGSRPVPSWPEVRLHVMDTIGVMCGVSKDAIQTVVSTGTVRCVLGVLRWVRVFRADDNILENQEVPQASKPPLDN